MPSAVALLRAVNVGGANRLAMADLRGALEGQGFSGVQTLLQSGNVVFESRTRSAKTSERLIRTALHAQCGVDVDVFVRAASEWRAIVAGNPFVTESQRDPGRVVVMVFGSSPDAAAERRLRASIAGMERVAMAGSHGYLVYPDGIGRSRLTPSVIERALQTRGTARNWNTVVKLAALL